MKVKNKNNQLNKELIKEELFSFFLLMLIIVILIVINLEIFILLFYFHSNYFQFYFSYFNTSLFLSIEKEERRKW